MPQNTTTTWRRLVINMLRTYAMPLTIVGVFILAAVIAYLRYPVYLQTPNFYAEDGTFFAHTLAEKGFFGALLTPFNGYLTVGVYILEAIGFTVNSLFMDGVIMNLPFAFGLVSYGFWALLAILPLALFWNQIKQKRWLVLLSLCLAFLPLPSFNYAILGIISDYKFAFLFIAFLLLIKRHMLPERSRWFYVIDTCLAICALTNATVYLLLPFALLRYWPGRRGLNARFWKGLFRHSSIISLLAVALICLAQLAFIALQPASNELGNYLKEPYEVGKTVEIFIHRTILFPFDYFMTKSLNDVVVVVMAIIIIAGLWALARREDRKILLFGLWAALAASALFVSQRTGVSQFFLSYQSSATDHFFYTQNLIVIFTFLYVAIRGVEHRDKWARRGIGLLLVAVLSIMVVNNDIGKGIGMARTTGSLWSGVQQQCQIGTGDTLDVPVYPGLPSALQLQRSAVCTDAVANYIPPRQTLPTTPYQNNYVIVGSGALQQTFTAKYDQLSGLSVFLSTFGGGYGQYALRLFDATCTQELRQVTFTPVSTEDNAYRDFHFAPLANSKDTTYCFHIDPIFVATPNKPVAVQLSAPGQYSEGLATKDGTILSQDMVFDILYK